ncbi:hypothetical protein LguiB_028865 [Lonicera macranthoides]
MAELPPIDLELSLAGPRILLEEQQESVDQKRRGCSGGSRKFPFRGQRIKPDAPAARRRTSGRRRLGELELESSNKELKIWRLDVGCWNWSRDGVMFEVEDLDTNTKHCLVLKKWASNSFVLTTNWKRDFVNRRKLVEGDVIGLLWNGHSKFYFSLRRAAKLGSI